MLQGFFTGFLLERFVDKIILALTVVNRIPFVPMQHNIQQHMLHIPLRNPIFLVRIVVKVRTFVVVILGQIPFSRYSRHMLHVYLPITYIRFLGPVILLDFVKGLICVGLHLHRHFIEELFVLGHLGLTHPGALFLARLLVLRSIVPKERDELFASLASHCANRVGSFTEER